MKRFSLFLLAAVVSVISGNDITAQSLSAPCFIENRGQWDAPARFLLQSPGLEVWITSAGVIYNCAESRQNSGPQAMKHEPVRDMLGRYRNNASSLAEQRILRNPLFMSFAGASPNAGVSGMERLPGYHNYYTGNAPGKWTNYVPLYRSVRIEHIYDGVDIFFHLDEEKLRYEMMISPGADPLQMKMNIEGDADIRIMKNAFVATTHSGELRHADLSAYQEIDGRRKHVECRFVDPGDGTISLEFGEYDNRYPLIVGSVLYSTLLGGSNMDFAYDIDIDSMRNAYIAGWTSSTNFPTRSPLQGSSAGSHDGFVAKFDTSGALVYATYFGAAGSESISGISVDDNGSVHLTGTTASTGFPTLKPFQTTLQGELDAFLVTLAPEGTLSYSTYIGGQEDEGGSSVKSGADGSLYVTGYTTSGDFPTLNALQKSNNGSYDIFALKVGPDGALVWSTFLGGNDNDIGADIDLAPDNSIYICGNTSSTNFPTSNAAQQFHGGNIDGCVIRLSPAGSLLFSTYLGGSDYDFAIGIAADAAGNAYTSGWSSSFDFPLVDARQQFHAGGDEDGFLTRLTPEGAFSYSTYIGGAGDDQGTGISVDAHRNVYMIGSTGSADFPTENPTQATHGGESSDIFITRMDRNGDIGFSTFLGGNGQDYGYSIAADDRGVVYLTGKTSSTDFPTVNAVQGLSSGQDDAFIAKIATGSPTGSVERMMENTVVSLEALSSAPITDGILHIAFELEEPTPVSFSLYDASGKFAGTLVEEASYEAGTYAEEFDVRYLASGMYVLHMTTHKGMQTVRFIIVR